MDTEGQDFLGIPSGKDAPPTSPPLDTSDKKTLADGTISRKQALKLMGAGTAAVASLALAGYGGNTPQAKGSSSGSGQPSGRSASLWRGHRPDRKRQHPQAVVRRGSQRLRTTTGLEGVRGLRVGLATEVASPLSAPTLRSL
jgi:hypothetical protein